MTDSPYRILCDALERVCRERGVMVRKMTITWIDASDIEGAERLVRRIETDDAEFIDRIRDPRATP